MTSRSKLLAFGTVSSFALMLMPVAAGALTANTTITSVVSPAISLLTTSGTVNLNMTPTSAGVQTTAADTVTVSTNDAAGYTLKMGANAAVTSLVSGANNIVATSGTQAAPTALTAGKWGYRIDGLGAFGAGPTSPGSNTVIGAVTYAGVPASTTPVTLVTTATTANNAATSVYYSAAADFTVPSGTYTQQVTYTATAN
jgi:hypothetical protein